MISNTDWIRAANWGYYVYLARLGVVKTRIIKGVVFIETKHSLTRIS